MKKAQKEQLRADLTVLFRILAEQVTIGRHIQGSADEDALDRLVGAGVLEAPVEDEFCFANDAQDKMREIGR